MPRTIRFHLDENCDPRIAVGLRLHGIDVTTTSEAGLRGESDERQLGYAAGEGRVILTHDGDFLRLATAGVGHAGIVYSPQDRPLGGLVRGILLIWELLEPAEMRGQIEYL